MTDNYRANPAFASNFQTSFGSFINALVQRMERTWHQWATLMYDSNNLECIQINHSIYQVRQNPLSRIYCIASKMEQSDTYKLDLTAPPTEKCACEFGTYYNILVWCRWPRHLPNAVGVGFCRDAAATLVCGQN